MGRTKAKGKLIRAAIPDLHLLQARRESGNYRALARHLPAGLDMKDSFDQETVLVRIIGAEVAAHNGDIDQMERMLAPYIRNISQVPFSAAPRVLLTTALLLSRRNQNENALRQLGRARSIAAAYKDEDLIAEAVQCKAEIAASDGLLEEAVKGFQDAIADYSIQRRFYRTGLCYLGQGGALIRLGEIEQARRSLETAVRLLAGSADDLNLGSARVSLAEVVNISSEYELSLEQLEAASRLFAKLANADKRLAVEAAIVETLVLLSCLDQAVERLDQATPIDSNPPDESLIKFGQAEARVYAAQGRWKEAEESARQAVQLAETSGDLLSQAEAHRILGEIYLSLSLDAEAVEELGAALRYARQARHLPLELEIKLFLAQAIYSIDKTESARLISEAEQAIAGRDLLQLQDALDSARKRNVAQELEHFFVLTGESSLNLKDSNRRLLRWMVSRALQLVWSDIQRAAEILKMSPSHLHMLVRQLKRSPAVSKKADRRSSQ